MVIPFIWVAVIAGMALGRTAEWRLHRRNYENLAALGAEDRGPWLMRCYYGMQLLVVPAGLAEHYLLDPTNDRDVVVIGLLAVLVGQILRAWAIASLGPLWTMRCVALTGLRHRRVGPYRFVENPEYLSRLIDGVGVALVLGAEVTALVYALVIVLFNRKLVAVERRQADELIFARPSANVAGLTTPSAPSL